MKNNFAIKIEGLGKRYQLGNVVDLNRTLREVIMELPQMFTSKAKRLARQAINQSSYIDAETPTGTFWALRDIDLEIEQGDVVGIIGRNGAGKSTLLKVLSRITTPTKGRVEIRGRVGSLLEVGTGFHEELTGRENIYLNGAILGMRKVEIDRKFDEIVEFAGTEQFLDTPVKRYSSGMRVRLAFSVAAHLEPEILIVDEVLAVGDVEFQKKCLGKMGDVTKEGRTVLFVSHNMAAIQTLCNNGIYMDKGRIEFCGDIDAVVNRYLSHFNPTVATDLNNVANRQGNAVCRFTSVHLESGQGEKVLTIHPFSPFKVVIGYQTQDNASISTKNLTVGISFNDPLSTVMSHMSSDVSGQHIAVEKNGFFICEFPQGIALAPGQYSITGLIRVAGQVADRVDNMLSFEIQASDLFGTGRLPKPTAKVWTHFEWKTRDMSK